jgi:hypothetical protein
MDATVSFWMKTGVSQATLFSNGRGDGKYSDEWFY